MESPSMTSLQVQCNDVHKTDDSWHNIILRANFTPGSGTFTCIELFPPRTTLLGCCPHFTDSTVIELELAPRQVPSPAHSLAQGRPDFHSDPPFPRCSRMHGAGSSTQAPPGLGGDLIGSIFPPLKVPVLSSCSCLPRMPASSPLSLKPSLE